MKTILALLMAALHGIQGIGALPAYAEKAEIPNNVQEIAFDTEYWLEEGEEEWYKFIAPTPQCSFTDMPLQQLWESVYGSAVNTHRYYDSEGNELGLISYTNSPDVSDWTEFNVGETYYIKVSAMKGGTFYTLSPVKQAQLSTEAEAEKPEAETKLELTGENVERFIDGEINTLWDVYTITEEFSLDSENEICSDDFFILPYRVCFDNAELTADSGTVTYTSVERSTCESWDSLDSYVKKPYAGKEKLSENDMVYAANHYSYIIDSKSENAVAKRTYDVYVPMGKRLELGGDGCFYAAGIEDIYSDVSADAWYTEGVGYCQENKYMTGTGSSTFAPDDLLTRAQFVKLLANIDKADLSAYKDVSAFSDVSKGLWFSEAVAWAYDKGLTKGVGGDKFAPDAPITRQQLAVFICTYAAMRGIELEENTDLKEYADSSKIADWAKSSMIKAVSEGLIKGTDAVSLSPEDNATRAQISLIIKRFSENFLEPLAPSVLKGSYFLEGGTCGTSMYSELKNLSGKENPHVLYIGMAADDPSSGFSGIKAEMCTWRGCTADLLTLEDLATDAAAEKIEKADIIYATGGSSRKLLARLKRYGTDQLLREAAANGTVMSGSSAGAICFGVYGTSGIGDDRFYNLFGTGCMDVVVCPHGNETKRVNEMVEFMKKNPFLTGIAVDFAGLEIHNGQYRIYTEESPWNPGMCVKYSIKDGEVITEDINSMEWRPLSELLG